MSEVDEANFIFRCRDYAKEYRCSSTCCLSVIACGHLVWENGRRFLHGALKCTGISDVRENGDGHSIALPLVRVGASP